MNLAQQAETLATELRCLGREARSLVAQGRLQDLEQVGTRRGTTLEQLRALYPDGRVEHLQVRQILDEVAAESTATQQLLIALRDELKRAIDETYAAGRAVSSYARQG